MEHPGNKSDPIVAITPANLLTTHLPIPGGPDADCNRNLREFNLPDPSSQRKKNRATLSLTSLYDARFATVNL